MNTIYISDAIDPDVLAEIRKTSTVHLGYGENAVAYLDIAKSVDAIILRSENFTRDMIKSSPRLQIIARHGVGTDNVDLAAASDCGVWVTTTPASNSNAVAEHVFALLLSSARCIPAASDRVRLGTWSKNKGDLTGFELQNRTLGVLGFGAIGRRVASIARGFGMNVLVSDPIASERDVTALDARLVDLPTLVREANVITVHVPLLPSTHHVIGEKEIATMKTDAFVINTSRGGLVDEGALIAALNRGAIGGVALDVLEAETVDMKDPLTHNELPIGDTAGLLVTPHVAGQTVESLRTAGAMAWTAVQDALARRTPPHAVATPNPAVATA